VRAWRHEPATRATLAALLSAAAILSPPPPPASAAFIPLEDRPPPAAPTAGDKDVRFLASPDPAIRAVQTALVEAWGVLRAEFVDAAAVTGPAWAAALQPALDSTFGAASPDAAWDAVDALVASLHDPYTRVLRPGAAAAGYVADLAGEGQGLGMQLAPARAGGGEKDGKRRPPPASVTVAAVVPGSPADAGGVRPGDEVVAVNGRPAAGLRPADLASALAAEADVELRQAEGAGSTTTRTLHLAPASVPLHAVQHAHLPGGLAYLRIATFNDLTPADVAAGLAALFRGDGSDGGERPAALVVDLRDNAGGSVAAAVDVAGQLLLTADDAPAPRRPPPPPLLARVRDGRGGEEAVPVPRPQAGRLVWTVAAPRPPTAVLVNGRTASSSELLAGALGGQAAGGGRDSALLVGERTFGKGRTQRAVPLSGGALLIVSNRTFATPAGAGVDGTGLQPGAACVPERTEAAFFVSGGGGDGDSSLVERLLADPCVRLAASRLGVELGEEGRGLRWTGL
jgi:carboxyl-terminal processing protease